VRISDFGLSRLDDKSLQASQQKLRQQQTAAAAEGVVAGPATDGEDERQAAEKPNRMSMCGTEAFMAPEALLQQGGGGSVPAADFWSLGMLLYEAFTGTHPFRGRTHVETLRNITRASTKPAGLDRLPPVVADFFARLLEKRAELRLGVAGGVEALKRHPFFALPQGYPMSDGSLLGSGVGLAKRAAGAVPPFDLNLSPDLRDSGGAISRLPGWLPLDFALVRAKGYLPLYSPLADNSGADAKPDAVAELIHFDQCFTREPLAPILAELSGASAAVASAAAASAAAGSMQVGAWLPMQPVGDSALGYGRPSAVFTDRVGSLAAFSFAATPSIAGEEDLFFGEGERVGGRRGAGEEAGPPQDASRMMAPVAEEGGSLGGGDAARASDASESSFFDYEEEYEIEEKVG
jgi:hypothetical protein